LFVLFFPLRTFEMVGRFLLFLFLLIIYLLKLDSVLNFKQK